MCNPLCLSRRHALRLVPGAALVLTLGGCFEKSSGPVEIRWGKEVCAHCGMIIDDIRFAAQIRNPENQKVAKFDDVGDGVRWFALQPFAANPAAEFWVGDYNTRQWIDARQAWYVARLSPMGSGFAAVAQKPSNEESISFAEMTARTMAAPSGTAPSGHGMQHQGHGP